MTFKKGQKVKIVGNTIIPHYAHIGEIGTVVSKYQGRYNAYKIQCRTTVGQNTQIIAVEDLESCSSAKVV